METYKVRKERIEKEKEAEKNRRRVYVKVVRSVRSEITNAGLISTQLKHNLYESEEGLALPKIADGLSRSEFLEAYNEGIDKHLNLQKRRQV